jgi:hypothetical protein
MSLIVYVCLDEASRPVWSAASTGCVQRDGDVSRLRKRAASQRVAVGSLCVAEGKVWLEPAVPRDDPETTNATDAGTTLAPYWNVVGLQILEDVFAGVGFDRAAGLGE